MINTSAYEYRVDQELPAMTLEWLDGNGVLIPFATGWTASVKVAAAGAPTAMLLNKTAGITLADTSPNYVIDWQAADFAALVAAVTIAASGTLFVVHAYAHRTADSKDRVFSPGAPPMFKLWRAAA